jgi:protein TonB
MNRPQHALVMEQPLWSTRRMISLGLVGLVHLALLYALLSGLAHKYVKVIPPVLQATIIEEQVPEKQEIVPPKPQMEKPEEPAVAPPDIVIDTDVAPPIQQSVQAPSAPPVSAAAKGINNTHTTPPYPEQERRAGVQGTVRLHIYVTAQGTVSNATVVQSSGNAELDSNAVSWVIAHWKYKPALASGEPVASETDANVKYDLNHAG